MSEYVDLNKTENPITEEELRTALNWIDGHKKKSVQHDEILKLLTYATGFCLVSCVMIVLVALTFGKLIEIFTLFAGFPVMVAALFVYNVLRKIKAASKE